MRTEIEEEDLRRYLLKNFTKKELVEKYINDTEWLNGRIERMKEKLEWYREEY